MDEKALSFDRKRHVCYSKTIRAIIRDYLHRRYEPEEAERQWERIQLQYVAFLKDLPYLGGKKCMHNSGAAGTYDCIAVFACYEALDPKPTLQELREMNDEALLYSYRRLGKLANMNHPVLLRIMHSIFKRVERKDRQWEEQCPSSYIMRVEPYDPKIGIRYRFDRCPIAEFARAHGYLHLMPAFCNGDYPALKEIHAGLIREYTCANGPYCDYWIVGDRSPQLRAHPVKTDESGYLRNPSNLEHQT